MLSWVDTDERVKKLEIESTLHSLSSVNGRSAADQQEDRKPSARPVFASFAALREAPLSALPILLATL